MLPYPEIYDLSDVETWKRNYLRKELLTQEWDLISNELIPDLFELPFFTAELLITYNTISIFPCPTAPIRMSIRLA